MKTLEEIKMEIAIEHGYDNWVDMMYKMGRIKINSLLNIAAQEYARQACEEQRRLCAEVIETQFNKCDYCGFEEDRKINTYTILNAPSPI